MDINQTPVQHFEEEEFSFPLSPAEFLPQDLLLNPIAAPLPDPIQTALQPNQSALFHDLDISALLEPPVQLPLRDLTNVSSNGRSRQANTTTCKEKFSKYEERKLRHRQSAEKSRKRKQQREIELEAKVSKTRADNRELKEHVDTQYSQLRETAAEIEKHFPPEIAAVRYPRLYELLTLIENTRKVCPMTYGDGNKPKIPLKHFPPKE